MNKVENITRNQKYYDEQYKRINISAISDVVNRYDQYLEGAIKTDISWAGMYHDDFKSQIQGKTIIELGCGDCMNVAIMAALGAQVIANDISLRSKEIINQINDKHSFNHKIQFLEGDFTTSGFNKNVDYVIGKAFLHHLTEEYEDQILEKVSDVLVDNGEARFFEPAINSRIIDEIRWAIPMDNRPSKLLQPKKFQKWEKEDPHPVRSNSSKHFSEVGNKYFKEVKIFPLGVMERFHRIMPKTNDKNGTFKRNALRIEKYLPNFMQYYGARSQVVIYRKPKK